MNDLNAIFHKAMQISSYIAHRCDSRASCNNYYLNAFCMSLLLCDC